MRTGPVRRAVRGGLTRRRVQTVVIGLVRADLDRGVACSPSRLVVDSNAPFDHAFTAQHGADVVATVNPGRATAAQLAATRQVPGVTGVAGPFAEATISTTASGQAGCNPGPNNPCVIGGPVPPLTVAGRAAPGGAADDLTLQAGHWATGPGQVVLDDGGDGSGPQVGLPLGTKLTVTSAPGKPVLTVVGIASSVTGSADGWVLSGARSRRCARRVARGPRADAVPIRLRKVRPAALHAGRPCPGRGIAPPRSTIVATQSYLAVKQQQRHRGHRADRPVRRKPSASSA